MWDAFLFAGKAVLPILLYMAVGYALRLLHFAPDAFWKKCNGLMFHLFLPVLLFTGVYNSPSFSAIRPQGILLSVGVILFLILFGFFAALPVGKKESRVVIWQGVYRSNYAIIGIPLAASLGGAEALAFASVVSAISIPIYNIVSAILLSVYSEDPEKGKRALGKTLRDAFCNPLVIGVTAGLAALAVRALLPENAAGEPVFSLSRDMPEVFTVLQGLGNAATPIALIVLGARLDLSTLRGDGKLVAYGTVLRVAISPLLALGIVLLTNIALKEEYPALIALSATPVAVASAVMVSEIGGDERLAGELVVSTSIFSVFSLTVVIALLRFLGKL